MSEATRNLLIIRDAGGDVIAAQIEEAAGSEIQAHILPADPQHTLDRVRDVPAEVYGLADPVAFHAAITAHVASGAADIVRTSAEELSRRDAG